jgi:hypothetical protein
VPVLLVTGPFGVGKTVVTGEAGRLLSEAGIPHAMADLAVIGACWPPPEDDRWNEELIHANLACMWENFRRAGAIGYAWLVFWIYWLASAASSKESVRSGWRTRLTGVSAVGVFVIAGVRRGGSLAVHNVILAAIGALLFAFGIALAVWARLRYEDLEGQRFPGICRTLPVCLVLR